MTPTPNRGRERRLDDSDGQGQQPAHSTRLFINEQNTKKEARTILLRPCTEMNKNRKGIKSYRELAEEAGVSVGQIAKAQKIHELGRSDEVISGKKTVNEILREEGLLPPLKGKGKGQSSKLQTCIKHLPNWTDDELETLCTALVRELEKRENTDVPDRK